jgi:hypothetical protein
VEYLQPDKPIPGQNFVCLSFVSPEKVIMDKAMYCMYKYHNFRMTYYNESIKKLLNEIVESAGDDDSVKLEQITKLRKLLKSEYEKDIGTMEQYKSNYEDYMYREEEAIGAEFDKLVNFRTNVRGLKVRGVYDTREQADTMARALQRDDQNFDIFVGQVGYWLPWDPCCTKIENQEYLDADLNNLVKEYRKNEQKKEQFYSEQKNARSHDALSTADRLRNKVEMRKQQEEHQQMQEFLQKRAATADASAAATASTNVDNAEAATAATAAKLVQADDITVGIGNIDNDPMGRSTDVDPWLEAKKYYNTATGGAQSPPVASDEDMKN